jgi:hypothetical protein
LIVENTAVYDFATPTRLVGCECDHAVEHVAPEPQVTEKRRHDEKCRMISRVRKKQRCD